MSAETKHLSVIIPAYNAETFIAETLGCMDEFMRGLACSAELIVVDDGSRDQTPNLIKAWAAKSKPYVVNIVSYESNKGKGAAVAAGILAASGKFRVFLDADLAYRPPQILKILQALEDGAEVAVASRVHPDSRYTISPGFFHYLYTRHVASRLINWALRHLIIPHCRDSQAGLKGFSAKASEEIFSRQLIRGFAFDVEALYLAEKMGFSVREVPIDYQYLSEPTTVQFVSDGFGMLRDVFRIYRNSISGGYKLPAKTPERRLAINADDFAMTTEISRGILKTVESGVVLSTSVMANSPAFEDSMDMLARSPILPAAVGLHLTLTWGRPLSHPENIPTLVDHNGNFHSRTGLLIRAILGKISVDEVMLEAVAQLEKLKTRWPQITHLDGHHHVQAFPIVCEAAARLAHEHRIRVVRASSEGLWSPVYRAAMRRLAMALLKGSSPEYWRSKGFACADRFGGYSLGASKNLPAKWDDILGRITFGTTEIMAHPGYRSKNRDGYNAGREDELAVLSDPSFVKKANAAGVKIIAVTDI